MTDALIDAGGAVIAVGVVWFAARLGRCTAAGSPALLSERGIRAVPFAELVEALRTLE